MDNTPELPPKRRWRRLWRRDGDSGQTLVEFALVTPVFLVLIFALVDFGRAFYTWLLVSNSAREGARVGAVAPTNTSQIITRIQATSPGINDANLTWSIATPSGTGRGNPINVTVNYAFSYVTPISPLLSLMGGSSLAAPTISSTTSMRIE